MNAYSSSCLASFFVAQTTATSCNIHQRTYYQYMLILDPLLHPRWQQLGAPLYVLTYTAQYPGASLYKVERRRLHVIEAGSKD